MPDLAGQAIDGSSVIQADKCKSKYRAALPELSKARRVGRRVSTTLGILFLSPTQGHRAVVTIRDRTGRDSRTSTLGDEQDAARSRIDQGEFGRASPVALLGSTDLRYLQRSMLSKAESR